MIPQDVLETLLCFTEEEINNLNGKDTVDRSIFINNTSNSIDYHKILTTNQSLAVRKHARFKEYPSHKHNYLELMYVYGGSMRHSIDDEEIVIKQGELLLLNQNIEHTIKYTNENDIIFNFIIKPDFLEFLASIVEEKNEIFTFLFESLYSNKNSGEYLLFKSANNKIVKRIIEDIIVHIYKPQFNNALTLKLTVGLLLTELMNHPEDIEAYTSDSYDKLLSGAILKYINMEYREGSLSIVSKQVYQPDYKICKVIKKYTGKTFKQLVQEARLNNAVYLLKTTSRPIIDIMVAVGYENITYFYKIFKQKYMMTPNEYRINYNTKK